MLSLGKNKFSYRTKKRQVLKKNELTQTGQGQSILDKYSNAGYNELNEGAIIIVRYRPNSSVTASDNSIVGEVIITFNLQARDFRPTGVSMLVGQWVKNGFSTSGSSLKYTIPGNQISSDQPQTYVPIMNKFSLKKGFSSYSPYSNFDQNISLYHPSKNLAMKKCIEIYGHDYIIQQHKPKMLSLLDDPNIVLAGCEMLNWKLLSTSAAFFIKRLISSCNFTEDGKGQIQDGIYFSAYNYQGLPILDGSSNEWLDSLNTPPENCSITDLRPGIYKSFKVSDEI
jgi:hypothetical protein